ncbi:MULTISPECIES: hypothetical protein [Bacillaceae]|uniref:Uncharacterized protein n=1 Tax=Evansella alkalicola TaxID=745819 RepID=A0ABS6JT20_9BACI|nr:MULTISPECIES: hypothetical protein [Bacillaceae]MBU9721721.1 hypothetical protein [Bacillus alkalicola]
MFQIKNYKITHLGSFSSESQYEPGKCAIKPYQSKKLKQISKILTGYPTRFDNIHLRYSPKGIICVLNDQVNLQRENGEINESESKEAFQLIEELNRDLI